MNSHIIPEFMYKALYDDNHRFDVLSNLKAKKPAKLQKGIREKLLCETCETKLSKHERYVSLVLSGGIQVEHHKDGKLIHLNGLDYNKFRLFGLSVLWRAGVSTLQMFEQIKLGKHEEVLRIMVNTENSGEPSEYPFMLCPIVHNDKIQSDLIVQPTWTKIEGHNGYRFVFGGLAWIYVVSSHKPPTILAQAAISNQGCLTMLISDIKNMPFITRLAKELVESGNLPS